MDKLKFIDEDGQEVEFYIISDTRVNGANYLLVTDSLDEEEGEALILKDTSDDSDAQAAYEIVSDDTEFDAVAKIFQEDLEDIDIM